MRVVLAILGAVLGLALFSADRTWFSVLLGAVAGLAIAEGMLLRQRLSETERALGGLAKLVARLRQQLDEPEHAQQQRAQLRARPWQRSPRLAPRRPRSRHPRRPRRDRRGRRHPI